MNSRTSILVCIGLIVVAAMGVSVSAQYANAQTSAPNYIDCSKFVRGDSLPAGFGAPWDVFHNTRTLLTASCVSISFPVRLELGVSANDPDTDSVYAYTLGYHYKDNAWTRMPFDCSEGRRVGQWCRRSATAILNVSNDTAQFVVGYVCQYRNAAWRCGCRDEACTQSMWQIQKFQVPKGGGANVETSSSTKVGYCSVPLTGAEPSDSVVSDCVALKSEQACEGYTANAFPYRCSWVTQTNTNNSTPPPGSN